MMPDDEDPSWLDWRDWELTDLWIVFFIVTVLLFITHILGVWR